jgi:hypothetical protein
MTSRLALILQTRKMWRLHDGGKISKALTEAHHLDGLRRGLDANEGVEHAPSREFPRLVCLDTFRLTRSQC